MTGYFGDTSHPFRSHLEPVEIAGPRKSRWVDWAKRESRDVIGLSGNLADRMNAIVHRRILLCSQTGNRGWQEFSGITAHLSDIALFIEGNCDDGLLADLAAGLSLLDWSAVEIAKSGLHRPTDDFRPNAYFALLKLCHSSSFKNQRDVIPLNPSIHRFAASGNPDRAAEY